MCRHVWVFRYVMMLGFNWDAICPDSAPCLRQAHGLRRTFFPGAKSSFTAKSSRSCPELFVMLL
jgi:hypothetical protein